GTTGTVITLHLKNDAIDYTIDDKVKQIVETYSDHIDIPVYLDKAEQDADKPINAASALWIRDKKDVTEEQYNEFYRHIASGFDEPALTVHWKAEGVIEYTGLLFIPTMRPFDLYDPQRQHSMRLYVKKVFISDKVDHLMYPWLRFVKGVIDTQDLPLNISREMLQNNPVVAKIRSGVTKKILSELNKLAEKDKVSFESLWHQFGAVLKEGLYDAVEHRDDIFKVCRFATTKEGETVTSLADYVSRMKDGQKEIYYLSGENADALKKSPQLEGFAACDIEVLLFTDTVDEFWLQMVTEFDGTPFRSVTKGQVDLSDFESNDDEKESGKERKEDNTSQEQAEQFANYLREQLKDEISYVRISKRLTESPVCLVAEDGAVDMHMEKVLKIHQKYEPGVKKVLEINKDHSLIKKLITLNEKETSEDILNDAAQLLLDQALIIQGETIVDPAGFAKRMAGFMEKSLD
ncbi:MAG: molecular chaperone HtpG, partial [Pseudomonadota bacterium]